MPAASTPTAQARLLGVVVAAALALLGVEGRGASAVSPAQKVIELLTQMSAKGKAMKSAEAVEFGKFSQFCLDTTAAKDAEVKKGNLLIESLSAEIGKLQADAASLSDRAAKLSTSTAKSEAEIAEAKSQREKERVGNRDQITDYAESVDALDRAIGVLQAQSHDRAQAAALLQVLPKSAERAVAAFVELSNHGDFLTREGPEAHAYEFQSTSIVDLLKRLRDDFKHKHTEAVKDEMNSKHAHDMLTQDLHDSIERATSDKAGMVAELQDKKKITAHSEKQLAAATKERDDAALYLQNLKAECEEKAKSFEEKQALREGELKAIDKAIEILSSPTVAGAAEEHFPAGASSFSQEAASAGGKKGVAASTSLAQLRRSIGAVGDPHRRGSTRSLLAAFLLREGARLHSKRLGLLAERVSSAADPFAKVKKMIDDLIKKLMEETNEESEQKGWCDKELGTNALTRTKLQGDIDALTARIDETEASITQMGQRMTALANEMTELNAASAEAASLRAAEKAQNVATLKDSLEAQQAIASAVAILRDFYKESLSATAFAQVSASKRRPTYAREPVEMGTREWQSLVNSSFEGTIDPGHREGMQVFGGEVYQGQQAEFGSVLAMLEVLASDFARLEAATRDAEAIAVKEHKSFMVMTSKSLAVATKEHDLLAADEATSQAELFSLKSDLAATQDRMLASGRYYETLKPSCVDHGLSFEERSKARQEEIESLEEALRILGGEDLSAA